VTLLVNFPNELRTWKSHGMVGRAKSVSN